MSVDAEDAVSSKPAAEPMGEGAAEASPSDSVGNLVPLTLVVGAVAFNLVELRSERSYVPLLNDGSVHAQMVRAATDQISHGHLPLATWYPYLGLGSPQFLHYQSLGAMVAGTVGIATGANAAFQWSLYLLFSTWPIAIYLAARLFGLSRWASAVAAACSTLLFANPTSLGIGYEVMAYLWRGYGLWSQLWAMWTLPIAWAASWQFVARGRHLFLAFCACALTIGFHFMTGYLALIPIVLWVLIAPSNWWPRLRRGALLAGLVLVGTAFITVPVVLMSRWTSINEFLVHTGDADSYGARQALRWLVSGQIYDAGRLPVVTVLAGCGLVQCVRRWRSDETGRALLVVFAASLVLFFGRPTLGPLVDLLPGSRDLFLRRFVAGVQLSGIFLAGSGAVALGRLALVVARRIHPPPALGRPWRLAAKVTMAVLVVVLLAPAWTEIATYDRLDQVNMDLQRISDATAPGQQMQAIANEMRALGPGRVFAGFPNADNDFGSSFLVGQIPVSKYLSNLDFDVVGYTLRTASLMTDPEAYFNPHNAGDYAFGIRYLVLPPNIKPVSAADFVARSGPYTLWELPGASYIGLVQTQGTVVANRGDIGAASADFLSSDGPSRAVFPTVAFAGDAAAPQTLAPGATFSGTSGKVSGEEVDLLNGYASAAVDATKDAVALLKVSYDPGWRATVDGKLAPTYMVAPALVGVTVGPGQHLVVFTYHGFSWYPELLVIGLLAVVATAVLALRRRGSSLTV